LSYPIVRPFHSSSPDTYCRLFEPSDIEASDEFLEKMRDLARSMQKPEDQSPIPPHCRLNPPPAGYTYFGQFVDHNLTEDDTAIRDAGKREPWETVNYRGPWLNLSGIYDRSYDQGGWKQLYDNKDGLCFRLGDVLRDDNNEPFDVPLDHDGHPVVGDERNVENAIIRQVHAMFLKIHNLAVKEIAIHCPNLSSRELFARARDRVCWQYQYVVRHDFLKKVCNATVFDELVTKEGPSQIDWSAGFSIPIEVSQAVMRFGHSMVRPEYTLNGPKPFPVGELLSAGRPGALDITKAVDWSSFLISTASGERAMAFDTGIVAALYSLQDLDIHPYVDTAAPHPPFSLPVRTLFRGAKSRLPIGQRVAQRFHVPVIKPKPQKIGNCVYDPGAELRSLGLSHRIPLWYYILLEAEVQEKGAKLGELGSRILIETINGSLRMDPNSYLSVFGTQWQPAPWHKLCGVATTLFDLAKLAGVA
jgi:hypothetical protein